MITRFKNWLISVHEQIPGWIEAIEEFIKELEEEQSVKHGHSELLKTRANMENGI